MKKKVLRERRANEENVMQKIEDEVMKEIVEPKKRGRKKKDDVDSFAGGKEQFDDITMLGFWYKGC